MNHVRQLLQKKLARQVSVRHLSATTWFMILISFFQVILKEVLS